MTIVVFIIRIIIRVDKMSYYSIANIYLKLNLPFRSRDLFF